MSRARFPSRPKMGVGRCSLLGEVSGLGGPWARPPPVSDVATATGPSTTALARPPTSPDMLLNKSAGEVEVPTGSLGRSQWRFGVPRASAESIGYEMGALLIPLGLNLQNSLSSSSCKPQASLYNMTL